MTTPVPDAKRIEELATWADEMAGYYRDWIRSPGETSSSIVDKWKEDVERYTQTAAALRALIWVRELVDGRWKRRVRAIQRTIDAGAYNEDGRVVMNSIVTTINECAAEITVILDGKEPPQ